MQHRITRLAVLALVIAALTGCASSAPAPTRSQHVTRVPERTQPVNRDTHALAAEISRNVLVTVYAQTELKAKHGCNCTLKGDTKEELFPAGTAVMVLKVTLTGTWSPQQGKADTQNVTGLSFEGTKFDGRPEDAVMATADGKAVAERQHLPWLAQGLFHQRPWTITNDHPVAFVAAWYVPAGVNRLDLVVNIPSEGRPTDLFVDLPNSVLALTAPGGE